MVKALKNINVGQIHNLISSMRVIFVNHFEVYSSIGRLFARRVIRLGLVSLIVLFLLFIIGILVFLFLQPPGKRVVR